MICFITGASGFVGSNLLKALLGQNHRVFALYRTLPSNLHTSLEPVIGDLNNPDSYNEALSKCDTVFHCAGYVGFAKRDFDRAYEINVRGTETLYEACLKAGVKKIVHLSACAVLGFSKSPYELIDESADPLISKDNVYGYTKKLAEDVAMKYALRGLHISIANIATVYGAGDRKLNSGSVIKMVYEGKARFIPPGGTSFVSVSDLVDGLLLLALKGESAKRYIFCSENFTYKELFLRIADALGVKRSFLVLPKMLKLPAVLTAKCLEVISSKTNNGVNLITKQIIEESFGYKYYNASKARETLGWMPKQSLEDTVKEAFNYYKAQGLIV